MNICFVGAGALGSSLGGVLAASGSEVVLVDTWTEHVDSGIRLSSEEPRQAWVKATAGLPDGFKPSLLQSIEKGDPTEIDFINGAVVRWGERCGVSTPVNKTLVACVKGIEFGHEKLKERV